VDFIKSKTIDGYFWKSPQQLVTSADLPDIILVTSPVFADEIHKQAKKFGLQDLLINVFDIVC